MLVKPFAALRPVPEKAAAVASVPYDVVDTAEARALATHITTTRAGEGAARELCDLLLVAGGHYRRLLDAHTGAAE